MSRRIRNPTAERLQGDRAGVASRAIASGIDIGIGVGIYVFIVITVNLLWDLFFSSDFTTPVPPGWLSALGTWITVVLYLAIGWGSTGRTFGKQIMGLRVVRSDTRPLHPLQALGRAALCASFYPGLLLAAVNRRNRGLEDVVFRTAVVYDWIPEGAERGFTAPSSGQQSA